MDKLISILSQIKPGVDFTKVDGIVDKGVLDSLSIVRLISEINQEYDIEIPVTELIPENFNSLDAIMNLINRMEEE